jgi:hypothetical protein
MDAAPPQDPNDSQEFDAYEGLEAMTSDSSAYPTPDFFDMPSPSKPKPRPQVSMSIQQLMDLKLPDCVGFVHNSKEMKEKHIKDFHTLKKIICKFLETCDEWSAYNENAHAKWKQTVSARLNIFSPLSFHLVTRLPPRPSAFLLSMLLNSNQGKFKF